MKRCSNIYSLKAILGLFCACFLLSGCSGEQSADPSFDPSQGQFNDDVVVPEQMSLGNAVARLSETILYKSKLVLVNLNDAISTATVPNTLSGCISSTEFPVLEYFCGSEGEGVRLSDYGFPIYEFQFADSTLCQSSLVNEQLASECVLEVVEAELDQNWFVRHRYIPEQIGKGVTTIQVSNGFFSSINDPSLATDVCVITLLGDEIVSYNDVVYCDSILRKVAEIAETS